MSLRWLAVLAGCGRIGFDTAVDGAGATSDGPPDGTAACVPRYVQGACTDGGGGAVTALSKAFNQDVQAGDLIVVIVDFDTVRTATVSDTLGTAFGTNGNFANTQAGSYFIGLATTSGADTVSVTLDAGAVSALDLHEYTGVNGLVASTEIGGDSAMPMTSSELAGAGQLVFVYVGISTNTVTAVEPPFTARQTCNGNMTADSLTTAAGNIAATFTASAVNQWVTWIGTLASGPCP